MRNIWTIAKREYAHYFITPIAYFLAIAILLVIGIVFVTDLGTFTLNAMQSFGRAPNVQNVTGVFTFMLMLTVPAVTMRTISEEARSGTLELLLTAPIRDFELIAGKWLGGLLFMLTILVVTLVYPLILNSLVDPGIDLRLVLTAYVGTVLVASAFMGLGVGVSALIPNQLGAFFVTLIAFMTLWWLVGIPAQIIQSSAGLAVFRYLDMPAHFYESFNSGILRLADVIYFLSLTALGLFVGTAAVEARRWR